MLNPFTRLACLLALLFLLSSSSFAQDEKEVEPESGDGKAAADQPLPASDEAIQAMGGFKKPEGWSVSLFAAEPEFANPVCLFVDNQSRLFVCESFRQDRGVTDNRGHDKKWLMADLAANSVQDRIDYHKRLLGDKVKEYTAHDDRIRMVVDTDGDGKADKTTIFAEHFNKIEDGSAAGILVRGNQAYFTCIPKLWKLTDSDGDGVAESRTAMHDGFGVRVAFRGHDMHGLIIGHDGRLYFSIGDRGYNVAAGDRKLFDPESGAVFRCELDGSNLEVFATGLRNPQELAFDDYGYLFTGDNNSDSGDKARWVNVMEGGDTGWRMMYQYISDRGPFNREKLWQPYSKDNPAYIVPPIENISDGPSGLTCYPGTGLTGDYKNCFFLVDFRGGASNSGIRLIRAQPQGAFWKIERSEQPIWNILATDAQFGPDGALWVCDWVNGWVGEGKGRVYRFTDDKAIRSKEVQEVQQLLKAGFDQLPADRLAQLLSHADRRIRLESQWELAIRGDLESLNKVAQGTDNSPLARLHASWGISHVARVNSEKRKAAGEMLSQRLKDTDSHVRAAAVTGLADAGINRWGNEIVALIADSEPQVQYAAAIAVGKLKLSACLQPVLKLLETNADQDPGLRHAGIMALVGLPDVNQVVALSKHPSKSVRIAAVVALRKRTAEGISQFLTDSDEGVQTEAARAINDVVALHSQLPKLASLIKGSLKNDALAHRVLNANFRLGTAEGAAGIAAFAADSSHSDALRLEAVEMLGDWSQPGKLDRVMNRYLPLEDRSPAPAKASLQTHFAKILSGSKELQTKALEVATKLKIDGLPDVLRKFAFDLDNGVELRSQAIESIVAIEKSKAAGDVAKMLNDKNAVLRAKAIGLFSEIDPKGSLPSLEKATRSDEVVERQAAWDALAKNSAEGAKSIVAQGLRAYIEGKLSPDVWMNVIEAAEGKVDKSDIEKLNAFEKQQAESDPLAMYRDCATGGDVAAGKKLFFTKSELSCVRCHKVGDRGGDVGPVLTEIAKTKDNRYLLESIVNPDAKIAEKFETIVLMTDDGQVFTGILRKDTDKLIELMDAEGKLITVETANVEQRKKGKSSMPPDLIKHISRRELRDLIAYLASLK